MVNFYGATLEPKICFIVDGSFVMKGFKSLSMTLNGGKRISWEKCEALETQNVKKGNVKSVFGPK